MSKGTEKYKAFKEQYNAARTAMIDQSRAAFKEMAEELFETHPTLESFAFKAFTVYFNDGDTCYYGVYCDPDSGLSINMETPVDEEDEVLAEAVSSFIKEFDDDIIQDLFGDHIEVTVYRDGRAVIEEYTDHS